MRVARLSLAVASIALLVAGCAGPEGREEVKPPTPSGPAAAVPSTNIVTPPPVVLTPKAKHISVAEIVNFRVVRHGKTFLDVLGSPDPLHLVESPRCESPGPCYDPPVGKVARVADGGQFTYPSTNTVYVSGHANRYAPDDPDWPFSYLQDVLPGDKIVVRTSNGRYVYIVTRIRRIPFGDMSSDKEFQARVPDRLIAMSCEIAPDRSRYLGHFVVEAMLKSATPIQ